MSSLTTCVLKMSTVFNGVPLSPSSFVANPPKKKMSSLIQVAQKRNLFFFLKIKINRLLEQTKYIRQIDHATIGLANEELFDVHLFHN